MLTDGFSTKPLKVSQGTRFRNRVLVFGVGGIRSAFAFTARRTAGAHLRSGAGAAALHPVAPLLAPESGSIWGVKGRNIIQVPIGVFRILVPNFGNLG